MMQNTMLITAQPRATRPIFSPVSTESSGIFTTWKASGVIPIPAAKRDAIKEEIIQGISAV